MYVSVSVCVYVHVCVYICVRVYVCVSYQAGHCDLPRAQVQFVWVGGAETQVVPRLVDIFESQQNSYCIWEIK